MAGKETLGLLYYGGSGMSSGKQKLENSRKQNMIIVVLLANILFIFLYRRFLFGGQAYIYYDVGFDTFSQYLPYYIFDAQQFQNGAMADFSLQMGLGGSAFERIVALLNPFEFWLLLCDHETMHIGIMVSLYIKTVFIAAVGYLFFERIFTSQYARIACSLIWTFCSYNVLWGQHYSFLTATAEFTLFMYVLQLWLEKDNIFDRWIPLVVFLMALRGYYFLYMVGIFSIFYVIAYGVLRKKRPKEILFRILGLGGMALIGILMAAFLIFVSIGAFFGSERSGGGSAGLLQRIFQFKKPDDILMVFGRLISNNGLGIGDLYTGRGNYYEAPMIFTSNLFLFSMVFSFLSEGRWKRGGFYILGLLFLITRGVSIIMTGFSGEYYRWTFWLCFVMIIGIGYMLEHILESGEQRNNKRCAVISLAVYGVLYSLLFAARYTSLYGRASLRVLAVSLCFAVLYGSWIFFFQGERKKRYGIALLLLILCEAGICNTASINQRGIVSVEWSKVYGTDGTMELVDYMKEVDSDLYRTKKTFGSVSLNDALAQEFYGMAWYESVIPSSLSRYAEENLVPALSYRTQINFPEDRHILLTLLGMRYIIAHESEPVDSGLYEYVYQTGDKVLYRNQQALPFGYLYERQIEKAALEGLSAAERDRMLTGGFYLTDEEMDTGVEVPLLKEENDSPDPEAALMTLSANGLQNIELEHNVFSGRIENKGETDAMLCIPIFYETTWKAYVDGTECRTYDINGGLIGIGVEPGIHDIRLIYRNDFLIIGCVVSLISILGYVIVFWIWNGRKGYRKEET